MRLRREHFFRKKTVWKTTWLLKLLVGVTCLAVSLLAGPFLLEQIGHSLIHADELEPVDLIVVEDFDDNYWLLRVAARLRDDGFAQRVIVVKSARAAAGVITSGLAAEAGLQDYELLEQEAVEPIALNAALGLRRRLSDDDSVQSIIVVAMAFRSRRSCLIYESVFETRRTRVLCRPVLGPRGPQNWWHTWHGAQVVSLEFLKLQYYRLRFL